MDEFKNEEYSNRFKAQIALKARDEDAIHKLSQKYDIPVPRIKAWAKEVEERAEFLFIEQGASGDDEAIRNYAALLRTTLESSPNGILVTDLERNVITYNKQCAAMWEIPEQVVARGKMKEIMQHILKLVAHPEAFEEGVKKLYEQPAQTLSDVIELKDGRFFERHSTPYRDEGKIIGRVTNFVDITEYKKTEDKLRRFGNLLNSVNTNVNEGILRSTPDEGLIYVNDAFVDIFGYDSREEVLATDPIQFYADEADRKKLIEKLKKDKHFKNEEVLFRRKDGSTFWGLENSAFIHEDNGVYIDGVVTDIDTRKRAENALRKSEEKYRTILKNIEEGYFETNLHGDFTFFNSALVEMMGYPAEEMIGMNNRDYMDEENAQKVFKTFNRVYETGEPEQGFEWRLICYDGSTIDVEVSVTLYKDSRGKPIGFIGMVRDVTERKQKEKQIRNSLKEKEVLLGEIHHRVKNNLAIISGLLYLQAEKAEDEVTKHALLQSQNRISSMALIHELLYDNKTFSSIDPKLYISRLVEHISTNLSTGETDVKTVVEVEDFDLEMSTAIPCALIINELITNAYKYAFEGKDEGKITVAFRKENSGDYYLEVSDNGAGLPQDFKLHDRSRHSLRLSLVKTLSRQLKGELALKKGEGAGFIITFPANH